MKTLVATPDPPEPDPAPLWVFSTWNTAPSSVVVSSTHTTVWATWSC
jgi:hypothetical protein